MRRVDYWKRPWCREGLRAGGEGDDRGWDGWMASLTRWTWVWVNSRSWWWTGRPGVLQFMGSQRVGHDWATELTELNWDVFLELSCFFDDPADVGSLISGSKSSRNIWKFLVHILLKTSLKDFEHYLVSIWNESNCVVVWTLFSISLSLRLKWKLTFSSPIATAEFSKFADILSIAL